MARMHRLDHAVVATVALLALAPALTFAQQTSSSSGPRMSSSDSDRLFLSFAEDATLANRQWWEGQFEYADGDDIDVTAVRGIAAFQLWKQVEFGGRIGFGSTDTRGSLPDGTGATDFDLWGKYYFGTSAENAEFAVGGTVTVPAGDDTAGLGTDSFGIAFWGALRYRLSQLILSFNAGIRFNEDGRILGVNLDGRADGFLGAAAIVPLSDHVSFVGEARYEGERFDGFDPDFRLLGGLNWRVTNRGQIRGGAAFGLTDGAPNAQLLVSYAAQF